MKAIQRTETHPMAKVQKTFYLNEELDRVIDALTQGTGASFTKIVTASLIKYLFGDFLLPRNQDQLWMRLAVALERGDLTLPYVALAVADHRELKPDRILGIVLQDLTSIDPKIGQEIESLRRKVWSRTASILRKLIDKDDNTIEALIAFVNYQAIADPRSNNVNL